jgi:DNA-binding NtrC family response regulator
MRDAHLLIVDDDALIRRLLRRIAALVRPSANVVEAQSVAQALRLVAVTPLDVVITDFHLPDGIGLTVLAAVHAQHPSCPAYVISGEPNVALHALKAGASGFLSKPLDVNLLFQIFEAGLNARSRPHE